MKRVVVTGAQGGTGRSIVRHLRGQGYEVVPVDVQPPREPDDQAVQLDLRDGAGVNDVFAGADAVVHFGSPPGINHLSATEAFAQVGQAGFHVFQAARNCRIKRVVWASSIMTYGLMTAQPKLPVTEQSPLLPTSLYGACKVMLENLAVDYNRWHGIAFAGLRLSRIIYETPECRAKLRRLVERPDLGADCLWAYVDARDVATACQAWIESRHEGAEVFNLGTDNVHKSEPTAQLLAASVLRGIECSATQGAHDTPFSSRKIQDQLGWRAQHHWRDILAQEQERAS